ncbi:hypothetical protein [Pseudomonas sp. CC6-YY-74]|uniref:hypothetical protein n=1 Tax=Pseudomonas sp. CC6-YY-74 TaxID=1930532 RepID=UPI0009A1E181|nr:hypothetical protein [Pseudomonas sp. CC6-YY-74]
MKLTILFFTATVAISAAPAFAEDLCTVNLQKLNDSMTTETTTAESVKMEVAELKKAAEEAQSAGDLEACGTHAEKALMLLEAPGENG